MEENSKHSRTAPNIDQLLRYFEQSWTNPTALTPELNEVIAPLYKTLEPLAALKNNSEAKALWLRIQRGEISDYGNFEELKSFGEVESYEEFEESWKADYPDEEKWYELVLVESYYPDGTLRFRSVALDNRTIISGRTDVENQMSLSEQDAADALCKLILPAAEDSMRLLREGKYNDMVSEQLPLEFRTGVIQRRNEWRCNPERRQYDYDNLSEETVAEVKAILSEKGNEEDKVGRMKTFTANAFFKACCLGYQACGYDLTGLSPAEAYLRFADGRDEGLTGTGHDLNEGPGIDFGDPKAWDDWFFSRRMGGHPWEVVRGGNSTHVDLRVCHDKQHIEFEHRIGRLTSEEYNRQMENAGYYLTVAGTHRQFEAVNFYIALRTAGYPVVLSNSDELLARFSGDDYIGIVPHDMPTRYCENLFPDKYGVIIDFIHVYKDDLPVREPYIEWLPEEKAELKLEKKD